MLTLFYTPSKFNVAPWKFIICSLNLLCFLRFIAFCSINFLFHLKVFYVKLRVESELGSVHKTWTSYNLVGRLSLDDCKGLWPEINFSFYVKENVRKCEHLEKVSKSRFFLTFLFQNLCVHVVVKFPQFSCSNSQFTQINY